MGDIDDLVVNPAYQEEKTVSGLSLGRRKFIGQASAFLAMVSMGQEALAKTWGGLTKRFTFQSVDISRVNDDIVIPPGYSWVVLAAWGDPINGLSPKIRYDVSDDYQLQEQQFGMHHDGCAFFPDNGSSTKGLWVVNHEYTDDGLLHVDGMNHWSFDKVKKSQAAHGVTIAHISRGVDKRWHVVSGSKARRITAYTPCFISGPASGSDEMKTASDPMGKTVLGTLNNCANGITPWGTYLTCEENFNLYFTKAGELTKQEARVGLTKDGAGYRWQEFDERFSVNKHPNEVNRFGWVVEIDPNNPNAEPIKRTALGRFKHEGAKVVLASDGRVVVYMGDDQKGEYIYKYVSRLPYKKGMSNPGSLLDDGTLFVAKFNADGSGVWLPLIHGQNGLSSENGFSNQAQVVIHARMAADKVGATPMDRPEWIATHPKTGEVYVTLTNNSDRGKDQPVDAANPRKNNVMGHIVRWRQNNDDAADFKFTWEIYVLAGDKTSSNLDHQGNINGDTFGSPDGLWFDRRGILWTQTDISTSAMGKGPYANMPNNAMYASDPMTREYRRFLIGPKGCEITGIDMTPDCKTMFINIQHPGETASERNDPNNPKAISSWPDREKFSRPRSATIVIWKNDGNEIGI